MTQEEKQLLLKDLCARLPYGVKGSIDGFGTVHLRGYANFVGDDIAIEHNGDLSWIGINHFKPYLRPMSSMTEEEDKDWQFYKNRIAESCDELLNKRITELHDWFHRKHFDYRGLIPMGLALEATKDMYKTE